ncbi:MAG TPA: RcpC/CpaB family pilus assembly protein [Solirubrobacteraceae bacterium]|nr:RcpC/CpaB family pilus assembly protein [Solirubrobacteraceae bacterium]
MSRRRRAAVLLGLALVLGALAASDVTSRERALDRRLRPLVPVVVAQRPVRAGARLDVSALAIRVVPARYAPGQSFRSPGDVAGRRAAVSVPAGADLTASVVDDGRPAAPVPVLRRGERVASVVAVGDPGAVRAGGRVDVVVTREGGAQGAGASRLALEDVPVLAVRPAPEGAHANGEPQLVLTLRVGVRAAVELAAAQNLAAEVRVLARAPGDRARGARGLQVASP